MSGLARWSSPALALFALLGALALPAQEAAEPMPCDDGWRGGWRGRSGVCEIREITLPAGALAVDGGPNGGISVAGSDRGDILVRARVMAWADDEQAARDLASRVEILTDDTVRAEGPASDRRESWAVSYEILAPRTTDLTLEASNGGIAITDVHGDIEFTTVNGGVRLDGLGGNVRGRTTNGGLNIRLTGDAWNGEGMDIEVTNGGVRMQVPKSYSAQLEASTVNGGVNIDFPVTVQGRIARDVSTTLGEGGPPVRIRTVNGGVRIDSY